MWKGCKSELLTRILRRAKQKVVLATKPLLYGTEMGRTKHWKLPITDSLYKQIIGRSQYR